MHLKYEFEKMEFNGQLIAVPVSDNAKEFRGVIKMNDTASSIFNLLKEDTTEAAIVDAMMEEFDVDRELLAADVRKYILEFREKGLIVE